MFIQQLFEGEIKRVIAIYPGRFQPFHLGHKEVFETLQAKFGMDNVFIGTSNKTDAVKSPFNFSDKLQLMTAAGVNNHHVIEVSSPYMPDDYIRAIGFNPAETVLIFAVGAPDLKRLEVDAHYTALTPTGRPSKIPDGKSVGDPKPFKTFKSLQDCETADQHQYVLIVNEREKKVTVNGKDFDASHGTQVRALWNEVRNDPKASAQVLQQLYGRATPELAHVFNKIPDANAVPAPAPAAAPKLKAVKQPLPTKDLSEFAPPGSGDDGDSDYAYLQKLAQRIAAVLPQDTVSARIEDYYDLENYLDFHPNLLRELDALDNETQGAVVNLVANIFYEKNGSGDEDINEDAAGVGVIANKKQKNDPRYSMSMTKDVGPGEDKKNMKKLHLEGNRGYAHGFASPTAPSLGRRGREDDEYHVPDPAPSTWYIRANGKIIKDKMGTPFQYRDKEAARKAAQTMMSKPFNAGKKFALTVNPTDEQSVAEATGPVTHRIGLTVTDPNHPMVSKRGETYHKTVRVKGDDREKAINGAIAHYRRKGYKVHDHHYIGTVDAEPMAETGKGISKDAETKFHSKLDALVHDTFGKRKSEKNIAEFAPPGSGDDGNDGFSDETLKRMAAQWYNGDEDPRVEKTLMAAGWEIGQDEGYDDEPGVFVVQAGDVNGNSYMSWPANELRQGMAEGVAETLPMSDAVKVLKHYGADHFKTTSNELHFYTKNGRGLSVDLVWNDDATRSVTLSSLNSATRALKGQGMAEGAELKQVKRKYNQAAKDANADQVGAGKKIDTMKKSLRQKDVDNKKEIDEGATGAKPGWMLKQDPALAKKVKDSKRGHEELKKWAGKPVPKDDKQGMAEGKKPDNYHIVDKDGKPASLASYADKTSAEKDRDAKHPGAEVRQVGPRGKVKGVSEGLPQTLRKVVPGYAKREIDKKMDAEKFGRTDVDRDANYWRYKKIQDKLKGQGVAEGAESMTPNWAKYVLDQIYNSDGTVTLTDLFDEGIPGLHDMFMDIAQQHGLDPEEEFEEVQHELTLELEDLIKGGYDIDETGLRLDHKRNRFRSLSVHENAEQLSVGDPVVITGQGIEFEGKTGDIDSFGEGNRFVVVNLYNHGKHSFHSSDVSYNDYADEQDDLDEDLYQYDKEDPYNSEFAPRAGMGRMTLRGWKQQMIKRTAELAQQMAAAGQDIDKSALWDNVHAKLKSMNMDPIAQEIEQAQAELEKIRQRGGVRSRAFGK